MLLSARLTESCPEPFSIPENDCVKSAPFSFEIVPITYGINVIWYVAFAQTVEFGEVTVAVTDVY